MGFPLHTCDAMTSVAGDRGAGPVTVALVNDYQVVVEHLRDMLAPFAGRVMVVDMEVGTDDVAPAEVALFDTLGGQQHALTRAQALIDRHQVGHVMVYARDPSPAFVQAASDIGVADVVDKSVVGEALVNAIEVVAGVASAMPRPRPADELTADGESIGRDHELLALLALGLSNEQIADEMFIAPETARAHTRQLFQRLGVRTRGNAAQHAVALGLAPVRLRPDDHVIGHRYSKFFRRLPRSVRGARQFVTDVLRRLGAPEEEIDVFRLAVSELASNAVMHGAAAGWTVGVKATREWFVVDVSGGDTEIGNVIFQPDRWAVADPDRPTGRGLGIVRQLMDEVTVEMWRGHVRVVCRRRRARPGVSGHDEHGPVGPLDERLGD